MFSFSLNLRRDNFDGKKTSRMFAKSCFLFLLRLIVLAIPTTLMILGCLDLAYKEISYLPLRGFCYVVTVWTYGGLVLAGLFKRHTLCQEFFTLVIPLSMAYVCIKYDLIVSLGDANNSSLKSPLTSGIIIRFIMSRFQWRFSCALFCTSLFELILMIILSIFILKKWLFRLEFRTLMGRLVPTPEAGLLPTSNVSPTNPGSGGDKPPNYSEAINMERWA